MARTRRRPNGDSTTHRGAPRARSSTSKDEVRPSPRDAATSTASARSAPPSTRTKSIRRSRQSRGSHIKGLERLALRFDQLAAIADELTFLSNDRELHKLELDAWLAVEDAHDDAVLADVTGLAELIAFTRQEVPRPKFISPDTIRLHDGRLDQSFQLLCGCGLHFTDRESTHSDAELKAPNVLLPSVNADRFPAISEHALLMRQSIRRLSLSDRAATLRTRCDLDASACQQLATLIGDPEVDRVELERLLPLHGLARGPSGEVFPSGIYWDDILPSLARLDGIEKSIKSALAAYDLQDPSAQHEEKRANAVAWAWNRYHLAYADAIKIGRHVPGSPPLPPERFPREGVGIATDISAAMIDLRNWLEDLIPRARSNRAIARGKPSVAKPYTHDQLSSDTQVRLEQLCLQAIERLEAVSKERRQNANAISGEITASGTHTSETQVKAPLARLVKVGAIKSCVGRGGGYWLEDRDPSVPA